MNKRILVPWWYPLALAAMVWLALAVGFISGAMVATAKCFNIL